MNKIKIFYASDLHLNSYVPHRNTFKIHIDYVYEKYFKQEEKQDVIILAGDLGDDIDQIAYFLKLLLESYQYVLFTHGNHELYLFHHEYDRYFGDSFIKIKHLAYEVERLNKAYCKEEQRIYFFDCDKQYLPVYIKGLWFYGNPMWYDYGRFGNVYGGEMMYEQWKLIMNDSRCIIPQINPSKLFDRYRKQLETVLRNYNKIDIVFTHVPPYTKKSDSIINGFYHFQFNKYFDDDFCMPQYWISGHDHTKEIHQLGDCICLRNPLGYESEQNQFELKYLELEKG